MLSFENNTDVSIIDTFNVWDQGPFYNKSIYFINKSQLIKFIFIPLK